MPFSAPCRSWRPCVISRFTESLSLLFHCSTHVSSWSATTIASITLLHSPSQPLSRCSCPSDPPQSYDRPHQSTSCNSASHTVTRPSHSSHPQPHVTRSTTTPQKPLSPSTPATLLSRTPLLTKLISFRRLNRPRLAHNGAMSSSVSCCSVRCELHVSSGWRGCIARQATL